MTTTRGKSICNVLKAVRRQVAQANDIEYAPTPCHHKGECRGTCPACEAEVKYLERQLNLRRQLGRAVVLVGISTGLSALASCGSGTPQRADIATSTEGEVEMTMVGRAPATILTEPPTERPADTVAGERTTGTAEVIKQEPPRAADRGNVVVGATGSAGLGEGEVLHYPNREEPDTSRLYDVVEEMPQFPGGGQACMEFIKQNLRYPKSCEDSCIQGRVIVTFTVNTDGSLTDARVLRGLCEEMDQEALRIISLMPRWTPGKMNGKPVKVKYVLPITFRLQ